MIHRRGHDPFAPHPEAEPDNGDQEDVDGPDSPEGTPLEDLTKRELIARAKDVGVAVYGTKDDIIDRIRSAP